MTDKVKVSKWFDEYIKANGQLGSYDLYLKKLSQCLSFGDYGKYYNETDDKIKLTVLKFQYLRDNFDYYYLAVANGYEAIKMMPRDWLSINKKGDDLICQD